MIEFLARLCLGYAMRRAPSFVIGRIDDPYLLRWYLTPWSGWWRIERRDRMPWWRRALTSLPNVYIHLILRSDDDRALHDHPWPSCSIILRGQYIEVSRHEGHPALVRSIRRKAGSVVLRGSMKAHRLVIDTEPCWSLFLTGFRVRIWGFHAEGGWVPWYEFCDPDNPGLPRDKRIDA